MNSWTYTHPLPATDRLVAADERSNSQFPVGGGFLADTYLWEQGGGYNPYSYSGSLRERTVNAFTGGR